MCLSSNLVLCLAFFSTHLVCLSSGSVRCLAFKPDNPNILVSCSYDKTIKMWDITSGSCVSTVNCDSPVYTITLKENMIAAGCANGKIKLFALKESGDWGEIQSESPLSCGLPVLTIVLKDNMIVAGCADGKIKLFKLNESQDGGEIQSEPPLRGHRYAPSLSREYFLSCFQY